ncbi:MAG: hypothetical protein IJO62_03800 [Clostridia bacterium]|nr:hypothetical protein [Clostridia bacterium]
MFGFKKKNPNESVLKQMDGREIKYVTQRIRTDEGEVKEIILGKEGRIVVLDGEIRVMCGVTDVFCCKIEDATYYMLLSGDGITVSGVNRINNTQMDIIVFYKYHRK